MDLSRIGNGFTRSTSITQQNQVQPDSASVQLIEQTIKEARAKVEQLIVQLPPQIQQEWGTLIQQAMDQDQTRIEKFLRAESKKNPNIEQSEKQIPREISEQLEANLKIIDEVRQLDTQMQSSVIQEKIQGIKNRCHAN